MEGQTSIFRTGSGQCRYWYKLEPGSIFRTGQVSGQHEGYGYNVELT